MPASSECFFSLMAPNRAISDATSDSCPSCPAVARATRRAAPSWSAVSVSSVKLLECATSCRPNQPQPEPQLLLVAFNRLQGSVQTVRNDNNINNVQTVRNNSNNNNNNNPNNIVDKGDLSFSFICWATFHVLIFISHETGSPRTQYAQLFYLLPQK